MASLLGGASSHKRMRVSANLKETRLSHLGGLLVFSCQRVAKKNNADKLILKERDHLWS